MSVSASNANITNIGAINSNINFGNASGFSYIQYGSSTRPYFVAWGNAELDGTSNTPLIRIYKSTDGNSSCIGNLFVAVGADLQTTHTAVLESRFHATESTITEISSDSSATSGTIGFYSAVNASDDWEIGFTKSLAQGRYVFRIEICCSGSSGGSQNWTLTDP